MAPQAQHFSPLDPFLVADCFHLPVSEQISNKTMPNIQQEQNNWNSPLICTTLIYQMVKSRDGGLNSSA